MEQWEEQSTGFKRSHGQVGDIGLRELETGYTLLSARNHELNWESRAGGIGNTR